MSCKRAVWIVLLTVCVMTVAAGCQNLGSALEPSSSPASSSTAPCSHCG